MSRFDQLKKKLNKSEKALHGIISLSVIIHVVDATSYSFAFFSGAYDHDLKDPYKQLVPIVVYLLEMSMQHLLSVFIKVSYI